MLRTRVLFALALLSASSVATSSVGAQASRAPMTGVEVVQRMRQAYDGKWYPTLTFIQKTIRHAPDGTKREQLWFESVRHTPERGGQLRIDIGDLAAGNGVLYTADSSWLVRGGKLAGQQPKGNELITLIQNVYLQPVEQTLLELSHTRADLSKTYARDVAGRKTWVVGTTSASDTTSPQFWVDAERNVVVRALLRDAPEAPVMDVRFDGYVPAGKAWLATDVKIYVGGRLVQEEVYTDWKTDVKLDEALFDVTQWMTAPHWGRKPGS
jgi:hypothetical protein